MESGHFDKHGTIHENGAGRVVQAQQTVTKVAAKFRVASVTHHDGNTGQVRLMAVHGPGNQDWSKYTPSGTIEMVITNTNALLHFVPGSEFFVDFTPV